jgi:hypothetical protein
MRSIERLLQRCLNKIQAWADENGFQLSKSKTVWCIFFNRAHFIEIQNGVAIPVADEVKFLSLIFDRKLIFVPHIKNLKQRCLESSKSFASSGAHGFRCWKRHAFEALPFARVFEAGLRVHRLRVGGLLGSISDVANTVSPCGDW